MHVQRRPLVVRPAHWALRGAPRGVVPYYLGTELVAVLLLALTFPVTTTAADWARFGALLVVGVVQAEMSLGTERVRLYLSTMPHINMTSVWIFSGAVVLPPELAVLLTVLIYGHLWLRVWRPIQNRPAYRIPFSTATIILSCLMVSAVPSWFGMTGARPADWENARALLAIGVAALLYTTVNGVLIAIGVKLHSPARPFVTLFGTRSENALEFGTLSLGGATAAVVVMHPLLVALMLLPVVVLHRCVLMRQLEEMAAQDSKTGLLTDLEWKNRLTTELARTERTRDPFGVLIIDLDNFKRVNDTYGHIAGDAVLRAVADAIRGELRAYDAVGRWGGEEFAVLLPEITEQGSRDVAERIRGAVARLSLTVAIDEQQTVISGLSGSVGVAAYPSAGSSVERLVHAADTAMYQAKRNGRNAVVSYADLTATS
ncbi:diguanylate cyclase [Actinophytocola sp.]|uniref:GGDEF domain-containing protein n=1 Tax=Actinophytocola sp. TaxID=1872138 RepID=UPI002ED8651E